MKIHTALRGISQNATLLSRASVWKSMPQRTFQIDLIFNSFLQSPPKECWPQRTYLPFRDSERHNSGHHRVQGQAKEGEKVEGRRWFFFICFLFSSRSSSIRGRQTIANQGRGSNVKPGKKNTGRIELKIAGRTSLTLISLDTFSSLDMEFASKAPAISLV